MAASESVARQRHEAKAAAHPAVEQLDDLSHAMTAHDATKLPSTAEQYRALKHEIDQSRPAAEQARRRSEILNAEAADLRRRLSETATRVQDLEREKGQIDIDLAHLIPQEHAMTAGIASDRAQLSNLLAVLERLQSDMPPVIALRSDDALSAARGAMVLGGTLPRIYQAAAVLSERLKDLQRKRAELGERKVKSAHVGAQLADARIELDQLLAIKAQEADAAAAQYGDIEAKLDSAASQAANLETLLEKVAALRMRPAGQGIVVVAALRGAAQKGLKRNAFVSPVSGATIWVGTDAARANRETGVTYLTPSGAKVVSPCDGEVLFAGSYHKTGKVLILEMSGGYDLVLAGLDTVDVRPGDELLAGEPVGAMPQAGGATKLFFELRQNGRGVDPAPWMEVDLRKAKRT